MNNKQLHRWLDVLNYFDDTVEDYIERNSLDHKAHLMYEQYQKMIDEIYNLSKSHKQKTKELSNAIKYFKIAKENTQQNNKKD